MDQAPSRLHPCGVPILHQHQLGVGGPVQSRPDLVEFGQRLVGSDQRLVGTSSWRDPPRPTRSARSATPRRPAPGSTRGALPGRRLVVRAPPRRLELPARRRGPCSARGRTRIRAPHARPSTRPSPRPSTRPFTRPLCGRPRGRRAAVREASQRPPRGPRGASTRPRTG